MVRHWVGATKANQRTPKSGATRLTTPEEERNIVLAWRSGDRAAGDRLIKAFLPFVVSIAIEYRRWNTPLDDIIQQGCVGLLRAAKRFDPDREVRLVTYAAYWIRAEIRDHVMRCYRIVRLGTTKGERRALRTYRMTLENRPEKLALASGLSVRRTEQLLPLLSSSDAPFEAGTSDSVVPYQDRIASDAVSPEEATMRAFDGLVMRTKLARALSNLSGREQLIARERWLSEPPSTLEALGSRLGVTKERVRQIEDRTRQKVRDRLLELEVA